MEVICARSSVMQNSPVQSQTSGSPEHDPVPKYRSGLAVLRQFMAPCRLGLSQQKPLGKGGAMTSTRMVEVQYVTEFMSEVVEVHAPAKAFTAWAPVCAPLWAWAWHIKLLVRCHNLR